MKWLGAVSIVALFACGPGVRQDGGTEPQAESDGAGTLAAEGTTNIDTTTDGTTLAEGDTTTTALDTTATGGSAGWGEPELVGQLTGLRDHPPTALLATAGAVFASSMPGSTTWRVDESTRDIVEASGGGSLLVATASFVYAEARGPCCNRYELETLAADMVASSGWIADASHLGVAFFRYGPNAPPNDTGILSWMADGEEIDADVFESEELVRIVGVNSSSVVVQLGADLVGLEIGTWTPTPLVVDPGGLDGVLASVATDEYAYLVTGSEIRMLSLAASSDQSIPATPIPYTVVADATNVAWVDAGDDRRIWAAEAGSTAPGHVAWANAPVSAVALGDVGLYWVDGTGALQRVAYPR